MKTYGDHDHPAQLNDHHWGLKLTSVHWGGYVGVLKVVYPDGMTFSWLNKTGGTEPLDSLSKSPFTVKDLTTEIEQIGFPGGDPAGNAYYDLWVIDSIVFKNSVFPGYETPPEFYDYYSGLYAADGDLKWQVVTDLRTLDQTGVVHSSSMSFGNNPGTAYSQNWTEEFVKYNAWSDGTPGYEVPGSLGGFWGLGEHKGKYSKGSNAGRRVQRTKFYILDFKRIGSATVSLTNNDITPDPNIPSGTGIDLTLNLYPLNASFAIGANDVTTAAKPGKTVTKNGVPLTQFVVCAVSTKGFV